VRIHTTLLNKVMNDNRELGILQRSLNDIAARMNAGSNQDRIDELVEEVESLLN